MDISISERLTYFDWHNELDILTIMSTSIEPLFAK
jgi:hypothetical protein